MPDGRTNAGVCTLKQQDTSDQISQNRQHTKHQTSSEQRWKRGVAHEVYDYQTHQLTQYRKTCSKSGFLNRKEDGLDELDNKPNAEENENNAAQHTQFRMRNEMHVE